MPAVKTAPYTDQYRIGSVDAAFAVLAAIAVSPDRTLQDLARSCQLSVSQTNRLLHTLMAHGYVLKTPFKRYRLGYGSLNLGHQATLQFPLIEYAAPYLDQAREETQESVHLVQRFGPEVVTLDLRESPQNVRVVCEIGKREPLNIGGSGRVYLAYDDPKVLEEFLGAATGLEAAQLSTLREELQQIRTQGYAVARADFEPDAFSVAAPILGPGGRIAGSLAIAGPLSRLTPEHETKLIASALAAAGQITKQLTR